MASTKAKSKIHPKREKKRKKKKWKKEIYTTIDPSDRLETMKKCRKLDDPEIAKLGLLTMRTSLMKQVEEQLPSSDLDSNSSQVLDLSNIEFQSDIEPDNQIQLPRLHQCNLPAPIIAQIHLWNIFSKRGVDLKLFDDIVSWLTFHGKDGKINWKHAKWLNRKPLLSSVEKQLGTKKMKPTHENFFLPLINSLVSIPVFDFVEMVLSIVHDPFLMLPEHIIDGYDINESNMSSQSESIFGNFTTG